MNPQKMHSDQERIKNSTRNITVASIIAIVAGILVYYERIIFLRFLGDEILGLWNLFLTIFNAISLLECGVSSVMLFSLYRPIAEDNIQEIQSIMYLYGKLYRLIGYVMLGVGIVVTPFITYLYSSENTIEHVRWLFVLFLIGRTYPFFLMYRGCIFDANQYQYISTLYIKIGEIVQYVLQIVFLRLGVGFGAYLGIAIVINIIRYGCLSHKATKTYPYLKHLRKTNIHPIEPQLKNQLKRNISASMLHKMGTVVRPAIETFIISKMLGLTLLGKLSNYTLIESSFWTIFSLCSSAIIPSLGNLCYEENETVVKDSYSLLIFGTNLLGTVCATVFLCISQSFITISFGSTYVLSNFLLIIIVIKSYLEYIRMAHGVFIEAMGLFWYDRIKPVAEVIFTLIFCFIGGKYYGLEGVLVASLICKIFISLAYDFTIVVTIGLSQSMKRNIWELIKLITTTCIIMALSYFICVQLTPINSIWILVAKALLAIGLSVGSLWLIYHRDTRWKRITGILLSVLKQ